MVLKTGSEKIPGIHFAMLKEIDELQLSERLKGWKKAVINTQPVISTERAKLAMESWKETEGEDVEIRRAKLLQKILEGVPIVIHDWQLIVGRDTQYLLGGNPHIDQAGDYISGLMENRDIAMGSPVHKGSLSDQKREILKECAHYFKGKTSADYVKKALDAATGTWRDDYVEAKGQSYNERVGQYCLGPLRFDRMLEKGLKGFIAEAEEGIRRFRETKQDDIEKLYFWQAIIITCKSVIEFSKRYSRLARELAQKETDSQRKSELEAIARVCERVPENPAKTLHEAIQSITMVRVAFKLESPGLTGSLGRCDQYLWPFFKADVINGDLTLLEAAELIGDLIAYSGSQVRVSEATILEFAQESMQINHATLGGVKRNGESACNELTYLLLHVLGLLGLPEPHITFGWYPNTPRWALVKAIESNWKVKGGIPNFTNGAHVVETWNKAGVPIEDARDWVGQGCVFPQVPTSIYANSPLPMNMALMLDLAMHNGIAPRTGKRIGLETGDPRIFKTFDDLTDALMKQYMFSAEKVLWLTDIAFKEQARYMRTPFVSTLLPGCMERGKDAVTNIQDFSRRWDNRARVDVADSLTAIKKLVFEEKILTMDELLNALDSNFEGDRGEEIRQMCLSAPKYGNDIDEADKMVRDLGKFVTHLIGDKKTPEGISYVAWGNGLAWHYFGGKGVGALPNGRKSGEPLSDGSASPMRGADKLGPTTTLRSVIKAGWKENIATVLNQKFPSSLLSSQEKREKLADLTSTFLSNGGTHIQYNLVDVEELRDAQKYPENHKDLVVRVAGFSTYFVLLTTDVQDDIISRTVQGL